MFEIVRGAVLADHAIAAFRRGLNDSRLEDGRLVSRSLADKLVLRPELTEGRATDLLCSHGSAEMFRMLVVDRGWLPDEYERWLAESLRQALLPHGRR